MLLDNEQKKQKPSSMMNVKRQKISLGSMVLVKLRKEGLFKNLNGTTT